ncbi:MAG: YceD family protein [Schwartzia sp. (in: firmicutes)]
MGMWIKIGGALAPLGAETEFHFQTTAEALDAVPENAVMEGTIAISGTCVHTGSAYRVEGTVCVLRSFVCDRCLGAFSAPQVYSFAEDFVRDGDGALAENEAERFSEDAINIAPLVRDTILSAQPISNLCRDDCRGLCSRCGADLNRGECGCDRRSLDPRLAALAGLLNKDDEEDR